MAFLEIHNCRDSDLTQQWWGKITWDFWNTISWSILKEQFIPINRMSFYPKPKSKCIFLCNYFCNDITWTHYLTNTKARWKKYTHPCPLGTSSSNKSTPQGRAHISSGRGVKVEAPRTCRFLSLPGFQRARRTLFTGHRVSLVSLRTGGSWLAFRARPVKVI